MHQVSGRQTAQVLGSVLDDGMNADFEAEGLEDGEYGQLHAFEGTGDGFPTALLRVRVLVVAEEAENTTFSLTVSLMRSFRWWIWMKSTLSHEVRLEQHLTGNFEERQMMRCGYGLRELSYRRVVKVVCQGDAMIARHLEDFVLAVSVKGCPLDGLLAGMAPDEVYGFAAVLDA